MSWPDPLPDLSLLRLFDLLHASGSVSRAAEQLGLAQPTASIWLGKLRKQLGDPLFVRTPAGMQPTPRADELVVHAREALAAVERLTQRERGFEPAQSQRRFRISMTDASHVTVLPRLLARVREAAPGITLQAARIDEHTARALRDGDLDLSLGVVPGLDTADFYQQALFPQDWVCLVNARHPRIANGIPNSKGRGLTLRQYRDEGHVDILAGTGAQLLAGALARQRIERRVVLELPGFLGLSAIVSTTDLVATLPRQIGETLAASAGLAVHACPLPVPGFVVTQHWHARFHHDPGNRWLRELMAELFRQPGARKR